MEKEMTIANTINDQINAMDRMAFAAWGTKEKVALNNGLQFKTSGMVKRKCIVQVIYDEGHDVYNVVFGRIRKLAWKVDHKVEQVFFDQLVQIIDDYVG